MHEGDLFLDIHWIFAASTSLFTFVLLLTLVRWIGETQISQATYFNWVAGACMGNVAANMLSSTNVATIANSAVQLVFFSAVTILASWLAIKNRRFREMASGKPLILIHNGERVYNHMKRSKVDTDLLKQMLREQGYFDIRDIKYAILEPTGSLSVLPQEEKETHEQNPDVSQTENPSKKNRQGSQNIK